MPQPRLSGTFAERYLIERELGHGASAVVYLAKDTKHDREIALKVLSKDLAHALGPERFLREIQVTSRLQHPHILPIFDSGESNGLLYYVMPRVSGESLREKIDGEKQLPVGEAVRITCEVAEALAHAHAAGVIHRDVKPENIMLSDGHALLADFGIARALDAHTGERLTSSGLIVGTSAYMSPEQASGEDRIDARSDVYGLACVLYEMLAGVQPFTGPTTQAVIAQRFTHSPRPVSQFRPAVPEHIQHALEKAFAVSPADRQQSIREFASDLGEPGTAGRDRRRSPLRRMIHGKQKAFGFAGAALAAATAAFIAVNPPGNWRSPFASRAELDSTKYVVVMLGSAASGSDAAAGIYRSLNKMTGIKLVDDADIREAAAKNPVTTIDAARELATRFGAGRLVVTESAATDGTGFQATLYDLINRSKVSDVSSTELRGNATPYSAALFSLLKSPDRPARADGGDGRTNSLPAWLAYGRAHVALAHGDFALAQREFSAALAADESFAPPRVWSTQVAEWLASHKSADWATEAKRAAVAMNLDSHDKMLAEAIGALAAKNFPAACAKYREIIAGDSADVAGWLGLGDCQTRDDMILPWKQSPSGYRFRSSHRAAIEAYQRAVMVDPVAYDIVGPRMDALQPTASTALRLGHDSAQRRFLAHPSLDSDTLGFIPYLQAQFTALPETAMRTRRAALDKDLNELVGFATNWVRAEPRSSQGYEALAQALEARGDVDGPSGAGLSASAAIAQALRLSTTPLQRVRLTAREVRLRVKRGEFASASFLADSLLTAPLPNDSAFGELRGTAGMTGHIRLAGRFLAVTYFPTPIDSVRVPSQVLEAAAMLLSRAAIGDCSVNVQSAEAELDQRMRAYLSASERDIVSPALLSRSYSLLTPCTRGFSALKIKWQADRLPRMQQSFARNNIAVVRAMFDSTRAARKLLRPSDQSPDFIFQEAWLRAAIGDTAGAITQLDQALGALPSISEKTLLELGGGAALPRAMMLRADVAYARRDFVTAKRYANAVAELWSHADPELQQTVARMKRMATGSN